MTTVDLVNPSGPLTFSHSTANKDSIKFSRSPSRISHATPVIIKLQLSLNNTVYQVASGGYIV